MLFENFVTEDGTSVLCVVKLIKSLPSSQQQRKKTGSKNAFFICKVVTQKNLPSREALHQEKNIVLQKCTKYKKKTVK